MSDFSFSAEEVQNMLNSTFDFYIKGPAMAQHIQEKPFLDRMRKKQKTFSGGNGYIRKNVKMEHVLSLQGFSGDDQVGYSNPAITKQASTPWKEVHMGISVTYSELKRDGISVSDSGDTSEHSDTAIFRITGLFSEKLAVLGDDWANAMDSMYHQDGTQDADLAPGLFSLVTDTPTTGTVMGIDRAANPKWRNRALVGANKITHSTSAQTLTKTLRKEVRQLRRYGGRPNLIICGSTFLEKLENEIHEKGTYTQQGFVKNGTTDIGLPAISMYGVGDFLYDPTLDDLDRDDYAYFLDDRHIYPMVMQGEDMKSHKPTRPHDRYTIYRAMTWTGALWMDMANCHGVYQTV